MRIVMKAFLAMGLAFGAAAVVGCDRKGATVDEKKVVIEKDNGVKREVTVETKDGDTERALEKAGEETREALDKAGEATGEALGEAGKATRRGLDEAGRAVEDADRKVDVDVKE
jgi:hypothetical protein